MTFADFEGLAYLLAAVAIPIAWLWRSLSRRAAEHRRQLREREQRLLERLRRRRQ